MTDTPFRQNLQQQPLPRSVTPIKRTRGVGQLIAMTIVAAIAVVIVLHRQYFIDQITVMQFQPSEQVARMVTRAGLSEKGKFYLYASQADISDRDVFNSACGSLLNEKTIILGCYTGAQKRIYIYNVTDSRLDGVEDVTAAHEMLHAAYDRLTSSEKDSVNTLLSEQQKTITDQRLLDTIKEYESSEPGQIMNELHSIFATELRSLSPELEAYYAQYFSDRTAVVALKEKYEKVFTDLEKQQAELVSKLNELATDINSRQVAYQTSLAQLNADIETFNAAASQAGLLTAKDYYSQRAILESRITAIETERTEISNEIEVYNSKKKELDALNVQAESLNQSIDSTALQAPSSL